MRYITVIYDKKTKEVIPMENSRPTIIEMLEQEKGHYLEQLRRINIALDALRGDTKVESNNVPKRRIPWSEEISGIFKHNDHLAMKDIRNTLAERGYPEATENRMKATVYQTLMRKVKQGELQKTENGIYHKKKIEGLSEHIEQDGEQETGENLFRPSPE